MGVQELQRFMESAVSGGAVNVDLLRIARNLPQKSGHNSGRNRNRPQQQAKLKLVVDGECCLDRLYGGYFSDWACGGQWNRTLQFLSLLMNAVEHGNMELAIVFNGALEPQRLDEWKAAQAEVRRRVNLVLKHINTKGTPPPKVWWTAPICLRTVLRMALRHINVTVLCSMDDHHQEVIAYCRENSFHGLLADDAEYAAFDPPRYFSSEHLKLTYKGSLETKEYMVSEMNKSLDLSSEQLCVVAALLGNYLISEEDLKDFHSKLSTDDKSEKQPETLIKCIAKFVKSLPCRDNLDAVAAEVFGSVNDKRSGLLKQSIQYYLNGTKEGFLRYRPNARRNNKKNKQQNNAKESVANNTNTQQKPDEQDLDMSGFASETTEREQKSLEDYKIATANAVITPEIIIDQHAEGNGSKDPPSSSSQDDYEPSAPTSDNSRVNGQVNGTVPPLNLLVSSSSSSSSSIAASPAKQTPRKKEDASAPNHRLPFVAPEVLRTASERHQKGLMSPLILQALTAGEVRLPCLLEDGEHRELPSIYSLYKPVRQNVYAILFNLHHIQYVARSKDKDGDKVDLPEVHVREWVWSKGNNYDRPETVRAEALGWGVPTIQRLWFGSALDDKRRRLRALLTCLRSDTPLMLNPSYVPQHLLIMACVLRYIMSIPDKRILHRQELDAFIAQAFAPELMNSQYLQELTLPLVTSRGVHLATMFMQGVETALFANDACGAPIPWLMCCPWLFFDGKLFHYKLARAGVVKNLLELCESHIDHLVKVERMRKAILEGLNVQFAKPVLPPIAGMLRQGLPPPNCLPAMNLPSARAGRGIARRPVPSRGGQLQIAGVVVGSWGANYGARQPLNSRQQPQVTSIGYGAGRGRPGGYAQPAGRTYATHPAKQVRIGNNVGRGKKSNKKRNQSKSKSGSKGQGRGMTVETNTGETVSATELLKAEKIKPDGSSKAAAVSEQFEDAQDGASIQNKNNGGGAAPLAAGVEQGQGDASATLETSY